VIAVRGPAESATELHEYVAAQRQVSLTMTEVAALYGKLTAQGLVTEDTPIRLTDTGTARYAELLAAVTVVTKQLYSEFARDDLATAHRVLEEVTGRAQQLRAELHAE
jgi:hypothetical protein